MAAATHNGEQTRLENLRKYHILDSPDDPAFNDLAALAAEICDAPVSLISFLDRDREWFKSRIGTSLRQIRREHAFADRAIDAKDIVVIPHADADEDLRDNPLVKDEPHAQFFAGLPLVDSDGVALGALYVLDTRGHELTDHQRHMLKVLAHEAVMLLELRREIRDAREQLQQTQAQLAAQARAHVLIERELQQRERQLADAQRITHLGSWEWNLRTNRIRWSDELYRIYGVKPNEFDATYEAYLRYVHADDRYNANKAVEQALLTNGKFVNEERIVRADGAIRTLFTCGEVMRDEAGDPERMIGVCHDITERKQIEDKLQQSVSLLNATIEATADGILVVNAERKIVQFNRNFTKLWNLPAEFTRIYDDHRLIAIASEQTSDPAAFRDNIEKLYRAPECNSFDVVQFKDGRTFERYSCPQRLGDKIVGRVWSFRDVTQRTRALQVLRQSEERYRSLVVATAQIVWTTDRDGIVVDDSPTWRAFTGQTFAQCRGEGWLNAVHPRERTRVHELWRHAVATGTLYETEMRLRNVDSEWRHVSMRGVPVREANGAIREWVGFGLDITDRKRALEAVMKERDFSNALISSQPGIFYVLDQNGLNMRWNENFEKISGYSAQEIAHMRGTDFVPPEHKELVAQRIHQVFVKGEADVEIDLVCKSGKRIPYYCTGKLVHMEGGPRLVGAGIDVSDLKRAQAEVNRLNSELEQRVEERTKQLNEANKEMAAFTYTASHDLRSPIRAIVGFARAIREDSGHLLDDENRDYLERIISASDRMMQLIDDLLKYTRVGKQIVQLRPLALSDIFRAVLQEFEPRVKSVNGAVDLSPHMPRVLGDPTLLQQIFANLIDNALTYRKPNQPLLIRITCREEPNDVVVTIADNGIGIAPEHHRRIFEVFQRLHSNDVYPGTGIGLATVERAVEKLGGKAWVESELGKGSAFHIRLKAARP